MLPPQAIHKTVSNDVIAEISAAEPLAQGINIPKVKSPRTGPPNIPKIPNQALNKINLNMMNIKNKKSIRMTLNHYTLIIEIS